MRQIIKIPPSAYMQAVNPGFETRLKAGFTRCKGEAKSYSECVKKDLLETDEKACQK
jgi:hypothetical protein